MSTVVYAGTGKVVSEAQAKGAALAAIGNVQEAGCVWEVQEDGRTFEVAYTDEFYTCSGCEGDCAHCFATLIYCRAQTRAVEARFGHGTLDGLAQFALKCICAAASTFHAHCYSALFMAVQNEGRDLIEGASAPSFLLPVAA